MEIFLEDIEFHAHHGVFEQERTVGNKFIVNLSVNVPTVDAMEKDDLSSTVSYADLYEIVRDEMNKNHLLLESLAILIAKKIKEVFPIIESGWISINKSRPPISGMTGSAGVKHFF